MRISNRGIDFIKGFETFVPYVYDDKRPALKGKYREWDGEKPLGTLTIGYGHTNAAKHPLKITKGLRITEAKACEILDVDLDECEQAVNDLVKVKLTQGQFDALASFVFNCGIGNFKKSSILRKLNAGDYDGARGAFDLYVKSGGQYMRGLQRRRDGEQHLWDQNYGDANSPDGPVDHPAEVDSESITKESAATAGGGLAGAASTVAAVSSAAAETKKNVGEIGILDTFDRLMVRPSFWIGIALLIAFAYWRRWPAWFWRKVS
jgi:lysozyme